MAAPSTKSRDEILADIRQILNETTHCNIGIEEDAIQDLCMFSEDLEAFFTTYFTRHNISYDNFDYYRYFEDDIPPISWIINLYHEYTKGPKIRLTLGHLADVVQRGEWFDPPNVVYKPGKLSVKN